MAYRLTIATPELRALVVEAMRARADTLKRAATRGASDVNADRAGGRDVRSRAVKLVAMLGEAGDLERLALELEGLEELPLVDPSPASDEGPKRATAPAPGVYSPEQGTPPAEERTVVDTIEELAELAGLNPATLDDGDDDLEAEGLPSEDTAATLDAALGTS